MMAEEQRSQGLYQSWNEDLRKRYITSLDDIIKVLHSTPRFPFTITELDVMKLVEALIALNETEEDFMGKISEYKQILFGTDEPFAFNDLYDPQIFSVVKGLVRGLALKKIEKGELKPGNPAEEKLEKVVRSSKDLNELWFRKIVFGDENDIQGGD